MANIYVRSTDGSDADNGSTWALAKATLAGAAAIAAAGDTVWVSQAHAESSSGAKTITFVGTLASPIRVLCGDDSAAPPTSLATTATVTTTAAGDISITGAIYCYGITFTSGAAVSTHTGGGDVAQHFVSCSFRTTNTGSSGFIGIGAGNNNLCLTRLDDCTFKFAHANNTMKVWGRAVINGGSIVSGTTTPTSLVALPIDRAHGNLFVSGFDFSNFGSSFNLARGGDVSAGSVIFRNIKLPASWSGSLVASGLLAPGQQYEMRIGDSTDTNYRMWFESYAGSIKQETTIVRTSGASDGTTALAWKMATSANAKYPLIPLVSPEGSLWNEDTGSSKTLTVEIVHDSQGAGSGSKCQDDEVWLEVMYLGASGYPLGAWINDAKASVLATAANQTDSSETWTTTGMTTPVKQALSVTFTPQEKGPILWRVVAAKASKTIYVCPKAALT